MRWYSMSHAGWALVGIVGMAAVGCGSARRERGEHAHGTARVGGDVISTVDGHPITVGEVQAFANVSGVSPRDALSRLQSEALLAAEAARRGFSRDADVVEVARRGRVQALLQQQIEAIRATDQEVAAAYQKQYARFHTQEQRSSVHALVRVREGATPEDDRAAQLEAQDILQSLLAAPAPPAGMQQLRRFAGERRAMSVQRIPPVPRDGGLVKPYLDALYSLSAPGIVPDVVRTSFGWHVVVVLQILPATDVTLAEAAPTLRSEIEVEARQQALERLLQALRQDHRVIDDPRVEHALATLEP
jgi:PPIC-type PPIASE domain